MASPLRSVMIGLALSACAFSVAEACGDKLLALGGGVSFERVFSSRHPGKLILFLGPDSRLRAANAELRLDNALTRAGHTVRTVSSRTELESSLQEGAADLVVTDWVDARELESEIGGRVAILPVLSGTESGTSALGGAGCVVDVHKRKGRQVIRAVDQALERGAKGLPAGCVRSPGTAAS
jgi:hypothetical protein